MADIPSPRGKINSLLFRVRPLRGTSVSEGCLLLYPYNDCGHTHNNIIKAGNENTIDSFTPRGAETSEYLPYFTLLKYVLNSRSPRTQPRPSVLASVGRV